VTEQSRGQGFSTRAIHAGQDPDPTTGSVVVPVHATSTFAQDGVGAPRSGYEYARTGNPTRTALEACLAALEGARFCRAFASGMAAEDTLLRSVMRPGDHMIIPVDAYGGTFRLVSTVLADWGVHYSAVDLSDPDAVRAAVHPETTILWCETPTNPLLSIADISGLATIADEHGLLLVVDNTFASPYLQTPLALGAHAVVHSTTKYLGGHSDVVGGAVVTSSESLDADLARLQNGMGAVPGPFDSFLVQRGIKTLAVRMERHCDNAERVVEALDAHPAISSVLYPGLASHPGHETAAKQMHRFGGMVSIRLRGRGGRSGEHAARTLCASTQVFTLAESLGGVESLIEHPGAMTHASTAGSPLEVPTDLVRLSVGIEDGSDLVDDLLGALERD